MDRISTPSRVYFLRTLFSLIPGGFNTACVVILASSGLITRPPADNAYSLRIMYTICLGLVAFSMVASIHQALSTGWASWGAAVKRTDGIERSTNAGDKQRKNGVQSHLDLDVCSELQSSTSGLAPLRIHG